MRKLSLLTKFAVVAICLSSPFATAVNGPNIIIVMTDDQGFGDLGVHGNEQIETPNLDAFAKESLWMERFYVNPLCAPTRASLMTGRYHLRTGVLHTSRGAAKMFGDEVTIAELLRDNGYRTGIFGKWHLGDNYPMRPQDQGFEEVLIHKSGGIGQTPDVDANYFEPILWQNGERLEVAGYCTDLFFDAALNFVQKHKEDPFFLYLAPNVPHTPLEVEERYSSPFERKGIKPAVAKIYGMLKNLDENFGKLLDRLDQLDLSENTLIVFMSDNGPTSGRFNGELRGTKASVYEGGIRVPFYVRWPERIDSPSKRNNIAAHIDLLPTLLEATRTEIPENLVLDGESMLPLWLNESDGRKWADRTIFTQHIKSIAQAPYQNATAINERFKMVAYPKSANASHFQADTDKMEIALYDLSQDLQEADDISKQNPEMLSTLRRSYEQWFTEMKNERGFQPGLIHLGTIHENPSHLCRYQDGHRLYGTDPEAVGWPVKIEENGRFSILKTDRSFSGAIMAIEWQGEVVRKRMTSSQSSVEVELEAGEGMLDIWVEDLRGNLAPKDFDVSIKRL